MESDGKCAASAAPGKNERDGEKREQEELPIHLSQNERRDGRGEEVGRDE